eukprot:1153035-Pelagomonas_calceolata.AAC.4
MADRQKAAILGESAQEGTKSCLTVFVRSGRAEIRMEAARNLQPALRRLVATCKLDCCRVEHGSMLGGYIIPDITLRMVEPSPSALNLDMQTGVVH